MLPKQHRLPSPEVRAVMRRGRKVTVEGVGLVLGRNGLSLSRFAVVVTGSVDRRAVVRNRMRRLVRESVRRALPAIAPGLDGVFLVRKLPGEFALIDKIVRELLLRAGVLNTSN